MFSTATPDPDFSDFARSGCAAAFRRLVDRHLPAVHTAAVRTLGRHAAQAEDVAQNVFILLARKAPALPPAIVIPAWLHRQTVRLALNAVRSESRRWRRESAAAEVQIMNNISNDDDDALWRDLQPHMDTAMLRLPDADREALALRYLEKKSLREVGETLGLSTDAAQKRVERALKKLRGLLVRHTPRAITASVLAACLAARSVEAAPAHLAARISGGALAAVPPISFLTTLATIMTHTKALSLGALAGIITGGAWTLYSPAQTAGRAHLPAAQLPESPPSTPMVQDHEMKIASTLEGIMEQVQALLSEPDTEITRLRLRQFLGQLQPDQFPALLAMARPALSQWLRIRFHRELGAAWVRVDASAAMSGMAGIQGGAHDQTKPAWALGQTFQAWLAFAPDAAQRWLVDQQESDIFRAHVPGFITTVAESLLAGSPDAVLRWAGQLEGTDYRTAALQPLWARYRGGDDLKANLPELFRTFASLPDSSLATTGIRGLVAHWAGGAPLDLGKWVASLPPGARSADAAQAAISTMQQHTVGGIPHSPPYGMADVCDWLRQQPAAEAARIVEQGVLKAKKIGPGLLPLVEPFLTGPDREATILHAARRAQHSANSYGSTNHPAITSLEWARLVADPAVRDPLIYGLYRQGLQGMSPEHIRDFPDKCDWPDDLRAILVKAKDEL